MTATTRTRTRAALVVVACALSAVWSLTSPAGAVEAGQLRLDADVEGSLGVGPAFTPAVAPGTAASYTLRIRNDHAVEVEVLVYGADATDTDTGAEVASGEDNDGVGSWITAEEPRLTIPPGRDVVTTFTVTRPREDEDGGVGAIVVQLSDDSREEVGQPTAQRAAILVRVAASGRGHGLHVRLAEVGREGGLFVRSIRLRVTLTNLSGQPITPALALRGEDETPIDLDPGFTLEQVAAGDEITDEVVLDVPWWGRWEPVVAVAALPTVESRSTPLRLVVLQPAAVLALVLLAGVTVLRTWRRHQQHDATAVDEGHGEHDHDGVEDDDATDDDERDEDDRTSTADADLTVDQ